MWKRTITLVGLAAVSAALWAATAVTATDTSEHLRPGGPEDPNFKPLNKKQEAEVLKSLKKHWPERYRTVMLLKKKDPTAYQQTVAYLHRQWIALPAKAREAWQGLADARVARKRLLDTLRKAKGKERKELVDKLHEVVADEFDAEYQVNQYRLTILEKRLDELRAELKRQGRPDYRKKVIAERHQRLVRDASPCEEKSPKNDKSK